MKKEVNGLGDRMDDFEFVVLSEDKPKNEKTSPKKKPEGKK